MLSPKRQTQAGALLWGEKKKKRAFHFPLQNRYIQIFKVRCTCLSCLFKPNLLDQEKEQYSLVFWHVHVHSKKKVIALGTNLPVQQAVIKMSR